MWVGEREREKACETKRKCTRVRVNGVIEKHLGINEEIACVSLHSSATEINYNRYASRIISSANSNILFSIV